ncbi:hypothetical protein [Nocardia sp. NPDC051463]|uniref:hypothetical protein n=1 Tax=Nocardia sp. NPDC051463 TaxID=3154845 RepID=UPI00341F8138
MLFAFRESLYGGGTSQTRHALGYPGARLIAAPTRPETTHPSRLRPQFGATGLLPTLGHRLGVNGFFCALAAHRNQTRLPCESS